MTLHEKHPGAGFKSTNHIFKDIVEIVDSQHQTFLV